jgi:hypothetical protein
MLYVVTFFLQAFGFCLCIKPFIGKAYAVAMFRHVTFARSLWSGLNCEINLLIGKYMRLSMQGVGPESYHAIHASKLKYQRAWLGCEKKMGDVPSDRIS